MNITTLEQAVLDGILGSDFFNDDEDCAVWFFSIDGCVPKSQISGVVGSLVKKGLVHTQDEGTDDHLIWLSKSGRELMKDKIADLFI